MEDLIRLLIVLGVVSLLCAPLALILSLVALHRVARLRREMEAGPPLPAPQFDKLPVAAEAKPHAPEERGAVQSPMPRVAAFPERVIPAKQAASDREALSLEQRIGTRWVLAAGVITVIVAVGFFLKYAYDNQWIGPLGRVIVAAVAGALALGVGELTRRRGYGVVAKGVTALGFGIFYATVFAAHRWYGLIDAAPAFGLAIAVTVAAMLYAVILDEVAAAVLSLIGGYVTPIVLAPGANEPTMLFGYVLILSAGAMLCAYWRHWVPVNMLAFAGTVVLYTGWFERFYRPAMRSDVTPAQLGVAVVWLTVFFVVFLVLPLLHTLKERARSALQDMVLVLANGAVAFYYFWTLLVDQHRPWLSLCSLAMGAAYLTLTGLVVARCREDSDLRHALLAAALAFVTLAMPLYFETYAVVMAWAAEGVVLVVVALRYRSTLMQIAAGALMVLTVGTLVVHLPLHSEPFRAMVNPEFGTWCFVAAAVLLCHLLYRFDHHLGPDVRSLLTQGLYAVGLLLLLTALTMETWYHAHLNFKGFNIALFTGRMLLLLAVFPLLFIARPICPRGLLCRLLGSALGGTALFYLLFAYPQLHTHTFIIFLNDGFARALVLVASLFGSGWLLRRSKPQQAEDIAGLPMAFTTAAIIALWFLLTEEIWLYYRCGRPTEGWRFLAQMYISITWAAYATALMIVGFWRHIRVLRYLALAIFLLLLAKIFLVDTRELESTYRIAGFLATGLALVGVSYLYQHLKKRGFFEGMVSDKGPDT